MVSTASQLVGPGWLPARVVRDWQRLAAATAEPECFVPAMVARLPAPARRWLTHAIAPGTPLRRSVVLWQRGEIRLGSWHDFRATQVLAPLAGFVWAVTTSIGGLPVRGFDRFTRGEGELRHRLWGRLPLYSADGPDVTRSAAARLASEFVFAPAIGLTEEVRCRWRQLDRWRATVRLWVGGEIQPVTLTVSDSGVLQRLTISRWARPDGDQFRWHPFSVHVHEEASFGGFTIPSRITAGYDDTPGGPFIRMTVEQASYQ